MLDLLADVGNIGVKPTPTPLDLGLDYSTACGEALEDANQYRRLIGRLLYLNFTYPDIKLTVTYLSQFMHRPCKTHLKGALQVLVHLKGTINCGLFYDSSSTTKLECYVDADYAIALTQDDQSLVTLCF